MAFAAPTSGDPVIVDMETAMIAKGKLEYYIEHDLPMKPGFLQDEDGNPTTDPRVVYPPRKGTLLPFGYDMGHKGYCLAFMVEIISSILGGPNPETPEGNPNIFSNEMGIIALNPNATAGNYYLSMIDELCSDIKNIKPAPGFKEVMIPGEPEFKTFKVRNEEGIPVDEKTWEIIENTAKELGVEL